MLAPVIMLQALGVLGSLDLLYYHVWKLRLYRTPSARYEHLTHLLRGLMYPIGLGLLLSGTPQGDWFWVLAVVFALDFANSIADVILEPKSRAPLGGLPPVEYLVHIVASTLSGAITATFVLQGWSGRDLPTALAPVALPSGVALNGWGMVGGGVLLFGLELTLYLRSVARDGWRGARPSVPG